MKHTHLRKLVPTNTEDDGTENLSSTFQLLSPGWELQALGHCAVVSWAGRLAGGMSDASQCQNNVTQELQVFWHSLPAREGYNSVQFKKYSPCYISILPLKIMPFFGLYPDWERQLCFFYCVHVCRASCIFYLLLRNQAETFSKIPVLNSAQEAHCTLQY